MGNEHGKGAGASATPAGIQSMDEALQKRFSKGIQFNMKIVLKGDRNTGKTCLFGRMGGKPFQEAYLPTTGIQVTSILWSYKVTSDTVKVEVWDVVDKGKAQRKENKGGLKIFNTTPDDEEEEEDGGEGEGEGGKKVLDATFLNVYKGCNGVVLMFDMTKMWTWRYVEREFPKVPFDIPVIVLGNFRDLGEHRVITGDEVLAFVESVRPGGSSEVVYAESSMKNAFGLMHLHKFLSIPFLQMQQDMLLQQIKVSQEQMLAARDELAVASSTEDQNYNKFLARLQMAAELRKMKSQQQQREDDSDLTPGGGRQGGMEPEQASSRSSSSNSSSAHQQQTTATTGAVAEQQPGSVKKKSKLSSFLSSSKNKEKAVEPSKGSIPVSSRGTSAGTTNIEEFVPDVPDGDVDSFLEEAEEDEEEDGGESEDDDESEAAGHPVVARDEDLSSGDGEATPTSLPQSSSQEPSPVVKRHNPVRPLKSAKEVELTESEEEEEEEKEEQTMPQRDRQRDLEIFWGKGKAGEEERAEGGAEEGKSKVKAKSGGLLLNWALPESPKPSKKDSPDVSEERRERKNSGDKRERKKRSSKKRSSGRRKKEAAAATNGTTAAADPFGVSALDAWLNSDDVLQPTVVKEGRERGGREEVGEEVEGSEDTSHRRTKKHRERASTGDGTRHKKKHKSRHSAKEAADQTF